VEEKRGEGRRERKEQEVLAGREEDQEERCGQGREGWEIGRGEAFAAKGPEMMKGMVRDEDGGDVQNERERERTREEERAGAGGDEMREGDEGTGG
jgi:hypothetical protein